ncbi:MAG: hypothetical protein ABI947_06585 [Chloroflexota bacterium]
MNHYLSFMRRCTRKFAPSLMLVWWLLALAVPAFAQDPVYAKITSPQADTSLFGLVAIQGTAANPNMQRYSLEFDRQDTGTEQYFPIAGPISQQVTNGILGQWNTTSVPDGRYQIRLRVVLRDGTVLEDVVQNLHVSNKQPTALPTLQPSATALQPTLIPTAGPSPTPFIQQPPTSIPRATAPPIPTVVATLGVAGSGSSGSDSTSFVAAAEGLQNAFCTGVYIAFAAFAIVGAYSIVHSRLRPLWRRLMSQLRNDVRG